MNFEPGQRVRWYRFNRNGAAKLVDAIVIKRITSQSYVIRCAGEEHTVRTENLMQAPARAEA